MNRDKYMEIMGGSKKLDNLRKWGQNIPQRGLAFGYFDGTEHISSGEYLIHIVQNNNNGTCIIDYVAEYDHKNQKKINLDKKNMLFYTNNIRMGYHKRHSWPLNIWVQFEIRGTPEQDKKLKKNGKISSISKYMPTFLDKIDMYNITGSELPLGTIYENISEEDIKMQINPPINYTSPYAIGAKVKFTKDFSQAEMNITVHGIVTEFYKIDQYGEYIYTIKSSDPTDGPLSVMEHILLESTPPGVKSASEQKRREEDAKKHATISNYYSVLSGYFNSNNIRIPIFLKTGECLLYHNKKLYTLRIGTYINYNVYPNTVNGNRLCPITSVDYNEKRIRILYDSISQNKRTEITLYSTNTNNIKNIVNIS